MCLSCLVCECVSEGVCVFVRVRVWVRMCVVAAVLVFVAGNTSWLLY